MKALKLASSFLAAAAGLLALGTSTAHAQSGAVVVDFSNQFALQNLFAQARGQFGMWSKFDAANNRATLCSTPRGAGCYFYRQRVGTSTFYVNLEPFSDAGGDDSHLHLGFVDTTVVPNCTCKPSADSWMDLLGASYSVGYGRCAPAPNCPDWTRLARDGAYPHTNTEGIKVKLDGDKPFDIWDITVGGTRKVWGLWSDGVNTNSTGPLAPGYHMLDISNAKWVKFVDYNYYGLNNHAAGPPIQIKDMYVVAPGGQLDIAYLKTATQSSTLLGGVASRAVDWVENGNWASNSVTHTNLERAYWTVDLKRAFRIGKVKVFNRTDCCGDRLANFDIQTSSDGSHWTSKYVAGPVGTSTEVNFAGAGGRYVRVYLRGTNYLSLAEVEVFTAPPP